MKRFDRNVQCPSNQTRDTKREWLELKVTGLDHLTTKKNASPSKSWPESTAGASLWDQDALLVETSQTTTSYLILTIKTKRSNKSTDSTQ